MRSVGVDKQSKINSATMRVSILRSLKKTFILFEVMAKIRICHTLITPSHYPAVYDCAGLL